MPISVRAVNWSGERRRTPGWYAVAMLGSIAFLAYLYRMLWSVLSISIKTEMGLSDTAVGLLGGFGFALSYAITSLPFSFLIDLGNRVRILSACAALWALASAGCGLASSVPFLLAARLLVGVGEAGCLPSSYSLLVDFVPTHKRAFAFGILDALGSVGVMVGVSLSGWMASSVGWRDTFIFLGLPGVLAAAVLLFTVQEPSQTANYDLASAEQYWKRFSSLVRRPTFRWITGMFTLHIMTYYASMQWLPSFFARSYHMSLSGVGFSVGTVCGASGIVGSLVGAFISPRLIARNRQWELRIPAVAYFVSAPLLLTVYSVHDSQTALIALFCAILVMSIASAPALAAIQSVARPNIRATAVALVMFVSAVVGQGGGPLMVGIISDGLQSRTGAESLRFALVSVSFALVAASLCAYRGARHLPADLEAVSGRAVADDGEP
jgi:predicted MFS family arabinose efflux permease